MIKKLIINADDFGLSIGNTIGIIYGHTHGIITSTSCMMNMPYAEFALKEAEKYPNLGVGVHLNITVGKALNKVKTSFTDEQGYFLNRKLYPDHKPHGNYDELYEEWKAQIEKYISLTGHKPTHLDSHHFVHFYPWHIDVITQLAKEYDLPIRQREQILYNYEYAFVNEEMYGFENINLQKVKQIISDEKEIIELMCHPAFIDQQLYDSTSYCLERMKELDLLCQNSLKEFIDLNNIKLINYGNLGRINNE